jgi:phosphate binding protein
MALVAGTLLALGLIVWDARGPRRGPAPSAAPVEAAELKGTDDRPPRLRKGTPPPPPANHLAVNPTIICRTLVGLDGRVVEARVYQPRPELAEYERAALLAVRHFEFEPASRGANTVQAWINWPVTFADPSQILGKVRLKGSDTIGGELAPRLGTAFRDERADLEVTVDAFGSATAFSGLFDRSADIGLSSRSVNAEEVARASFLHLKLDEYVFAYDGIAVIVNPQNPLAELSLEQVSRIFSGKVKTWKEAGASKGGTIHLFSRPSYSGTHQFFLQRVVKLDRRDSADGFAPEIEWLERTEEIVAKVSGDPDAIGYGGLGWVNKGVKVVALSPSPGARAIRPTEDTIEDATYPVSRPLLMYTRGAPSANAASFLRFVFSPRGQEVIKSAGFVPYREQRAGDRPPRQARGGLLRPLPHPLRRARRRRRSGGGGQDEPRRRGAQGARDPCPRGGQRRLRGGERRRDAADLRAARPGRGRAPEEAGRAARGHRDQGRRRDPPGRRQGRAGPSPEPARRPLRGARREVS